MEDKGSIELKKLLDFFKDLTTEEYIELYCRVDTGNVFISHALYGVNNR